MTLSLDDWIKPGKCPMTVTIINTTPKETKMENLKDFLMIYTWSLLEDRVAGDPISFSKITEVTISEQKQDFELILPMAIIEILMENPEGNSSTLNFNAQLHKDPTPSASTTPRTARNPLTSRPTTSCTPTASAATPSRRPPR